MCQHPVLNIGSLVLQCMLFFSDRCCSDHCIQPSTARKRAWFLFGSVALAHKILCAPLCSPQVHRQLELGHEEGGPGVSIQQVWRRESESPGCAHGGTLRAKNLASQRVSPRLTPVICAAVTPPCAG